MHHCFKMVSGQTVLSPSEKGEGQALEALILILLPFVCRGKGDQPSFTHLLSGSKPLQWSQDCLFARSQWKITPEWKTSTKLYVQIQNKQCNDLLENHAGLCPREHHPFSAADILEWGPEAFYPQGSKQKKVYKAFCSSWSESHRSRRKPSFLGITPQPVFIILWYRNFQTKGKTQSKIWNWNIKVFSKRSIKIQLFECTLHCFSRSDLISITHTYINI